MRELEFRVWDVIKKKYIPNDCYALISKTDFNAFGIMLKDWEDYKEGEYFYNEYQKIELFTGLLDKNGNKIFINDTYKDEQDDLFKVIQMDCGRYALELIEDGYIDEFIDWSCLEIIGNIHETNK